MIAPTVQWTVAVSGKVAGLMRTWWRQLSLAEVVSCQQRVREQSRVSRVSRVEKTETINHIR